jgi:hypothetical protein
MTSMVPTPFRKSGHGLALRFATSPSTASKPRFMLRPWSPSPIAWSRAVSSSAWRSIVAATAVTSSARKSAPKAIPRNSSTEL